MSPLSLFSFLLSRSCTILVLAPINKVQMTRSVHALGLRSRSLGVDCCHLLIFLFGTETVSDHALVSHKPLLLYPIPWWKWTWPRMILQIILVGDIVQFSDLNIHCSYISKTWSLKFLSSIPLVLSMAVIFLF